MTGALAWDDFLTVLVIAEEGNLAAAARRIGKSDPTLLRRLNAIERRLGARLFERFRSGYIPTEAGSELLVAARRMRELSMDAERRLSGKDQRLSGRIGLTTTDALFSHVLAPALARFRAIHPLIGIDVSTSSLSLDLNLREADIALRPSTDPGDDLVGRRAGTLSQAIYVAPALAETDLEELDWIGPRADMNYPLLSEWLELSGHGDRCVVEVDTTLAMRSAAIAGLGAAVLPRYLAADDVLAGRLVAMSRPVAELEIDLWLVTHPDLRMSARVRALLDHLAKDPALRGALAF